MPAADLSKAASAVAAARAVVDSAARQLSVGGGREAVDTQQVVGYDLAHAAAAVEVARAAVEYGRKGEIEAAIACAFVADAVWDVMTKVLGREAAWATDPGALADAVPFVT